MKNSLLLSLLLVYAVTIMQKTLTFNPSTQTTRPFGLASANSTSFDFSWTHGKKFPSHMVINHGAGGLLSIALTYPDFYSEPDWKVIPEQVLAAGVSQSAAITEVDLSSTNITSARVCTGKIAGGVTVIAGVKFVYENDMSNYFHGDIIRVSSIRCVDASHRTPGYYLQSLSSSYDVYLNTFNFHCVIQDWQACYNDDTCEQEVYVCVENCCYDKYYDNDNGWQAESVCEAPELDF